MATKEKYANKRSISYTEPILYNGNSYPSSIATIVDDNGMERKERIFADANGNYYALYRNGNILPTMLTDTLPDVEVRPDNVKNDILQRQALLRAAGYNVPSDGSWDLHQQSVWDSLTTRPKQYDTTFEGLYQGWKDKLMGNDTYMSNPLEQGEIREYNPDNVDWEKTRRSQSKVVNALSGTWLPGLAAATLPTAFMQAPLSSLTTQRTWWLRCSWNQTAG